MNLCISVVKIMQKLPFRSLAGEKSPSRSAPEQKTPRSCDRGVSLVGAGNLLGEQDFEDLDGCRGDRRTGAEDGGGAVAVEFIVVLRGDHAADDDDDVLAAQLLQLGDDLRHERQMAGGQRRYADYVHVVFDGLLGGLLRSLEQRTHVDVEADVGITRSDHLAPRSCPSWPSLAIITRG